MDAPQGLGAGGPRQAIEPGASEGQGTRCRALVHLQRRGGGQCWPEGLAARDARRGQKKPKLEKPCVDVSLGQERGRPRRRGAEGGGSVVEAQKAYITALIHNLIHTLSSASRLLL